jgi:hypothetical protein
MSIRASVKTLLASLTTWNAILNIGDPDPAIDPASRIFLNESPENLAPPFMVFSLNQTNQGSSEGDGTTGLSNGSFMVVAEFGIPAAATNINEEAEIIEAYLEAMADEMRALSASGQYILLRNLSWGNPAKSDDELVDGNGNQFWTAQLDAEYGLTL